MVGAACSRTYGVLAYLGRYVLASEGKMTIEQAVLQQLQTLPLDKKQEVLDFVQFLHTKQSVKRPLRNPIGLFAHLNIQITAQDITEARKEMWGNFPRDTDLPLNHGQKECICPLYS
jgi:Protein of unknown function (DUF2281)